MELFLPTRLHLLTIHSSCVYEVALEICDTKDGKEIVTENADGMWDMIMAMSRRSDNTTKIKPPSSDTPHVWDYFIKHAALSNLLDAAVSHKDIEGLRTVYIKRIISLPKKTQGILMTLIEQKKKKSHASKTPLKNKRSPKKSNNSRTRTPDKSGNQSMNQLRSPVAISRSPLSTPNPFTPENRGRLRPFPSSRSNTKHSNRGRGLFSTPSPGRNFDKAFDSSTPRLTGSAQSSPNGSPFLSPGLGDTAVLEREFQELRERNDQLAIDLEKSRDKEDVLNQKIEDMESRFRKETMQIEAEARRREDQIREDHENELTTLKSNLESLSEQYEVAERAKAELAGVKDEMELMQHTKSMLAETSERLRNCKEKLQQLTDVKDALKREEEAHSKSVEECLRLENELRTLQPLKRQLDDYKTRAVDAEVRLTESEDELLKMKQQRFVFSDTTCQLEKAVISQQEEIEELRHRMPHEETVKNGAGVGDGLSELNPELKEEVYRLRNENKHLREFAQKREGDAVTKLEQELEDAVRLSERYKSQFLYTKSELETAHVDLKASRDREIKLENELASWMEQAENLQRQTNEIRLRLENCSKELEQSQAREEDLHNEVADLKKELAVSQTRSNDLANQLQRCARDLKVSEDLGEDLQTKLNEMSTRAMTAEDNVQQLMEQLKESTDDLTETKNALVESKDKEASLQEELTETTRQAEDSERVSKERLDLLQSTEEKLNACQQEVDGLKANEEDMISEVQKWSEKNLRAEEEVDRLSNQLELAKEEFWEKTMEAETLTEHLQEELLRTQENLMRTQESFDKVTARLEEENQLCNQFKQDLFQAQEILNDTQSSLAASQHREKMLNHEVTKLLDLQSDLQQELENEKCKREEASEEASRALDATREALSAKATKDMEEIRSSMNGIMEDERKAKRESDEAYLEKMRQQEEEFQKQIAEVVKESEKTMEDSRMEAEERVAQMSKEHEERMIQMKKDAELENEKLVVKGKGMIKDLKTKAKEDVEALQEECRSLEEEITREKKAKEDVMRQFKKKMIEYKKKLQLSAGRINTLSADTDDLEEKLKGLEREKFKLMDENEQYRRQLGGRFGSDSQLQTQLEMVQKEFKNALEETRELKRQLKNQGSFGTLAAINENASEGEQSYSRNTMNQSTLMQLRTEYEETIEALNDEKRELVMRNSAAITDVQKAEKRSWEFEKENSQMKQELTSLKLQVERLENLLSNVAVGSVEEGDSKCSAATNAGISIQKPSSDQENFPPSSLLSKGDDKNELPRRKTFGGVLSPSNVQVDQNIPDTGAVAKSPVAALVVPTAVPKMGDSPKIASFVEYTAKSPGKDVPPECKQS